MSFKKDYYLNKRVLVTGGSEGMGASLVEHLCNSGALVTALSRSESKLGALKKRLTTSNPKIKLSTLSCDVTKSDETKQKLTAAYGSSPWDLVINCAGFAHPNYFVETSEESARKMMDLNYFGIFNVLKVVVPLMVEKKSGQIVNFSSMSGYLGLFGYSAYCASKFAVVGFSESLYRELAPYGISVSVACPPGTQTPGFDLENLSKPDEVLEIEKKAKILSADEVAIAVLKEIPSRKFMINPSFDAKLAHLINRFSPTILNQFVKRKTK